MKLFPPPADIQLYEDGFLEKDLLGRGAEGKKLSEIVERIEDPLVVAVDGNWGVGKSHFLKCWVGAHTKENDGTAITVYFDAFAMDFLDDPLVALTGALDARFIQLGIKSSAWDKAKKATAVLSRVAVSVGVGVLTAGIVRNASELVAAAATTTGNETSEEVDKFWSREKTKIEAIESFKTALAKATQADAEAGTSRRIVVVVDELDRCRPDYALALLEVVKHFFSVPNVHFVLGVNLAELENSVRARYGQGVDARRYLHKSITFSIQLSEDSDVRGHLTPTAIVYFSTMADKMGLPRPLVELAEKYLSCLRDKPTIRDVQKILSAIALLPSLDKKLTGYVVTAISLLFIKHFDPALFGKIKRGEAQLIEICGFLGHPVPAADDDPRTWADFNVTETVIAWARILRENLPGQFDGEFSHRLFGMDEYPRDGFVLSIIRDYLDVFHWSEDPTLPETAATKQ